ncbi:DUF3290 family protein [Nicoliella spurrieriana]|uniref:DUF3290 family protein n=1 Tax=Nicoliella spurrieriana TaxID=2925830 RepID=A0A976RSA1_9LACO|nr:DUF3290 family protein [Nicoliella spurrieriana]UQS86873.1 DUF3290 family protein [Nicoliella spurrieriana]
MNFYSYNYLNQNYDRLNYAFLLIMILFAVALIVLGTKYLKNRTNLKFRDLIILTLFVALAMVGIQITNINNSGYSNGQQTARFLKQISIEHHVELNHVYSDSNVIKDGMTIKVGSKYYSVTVNDSQTGYKLNSIDAIKGQQINYVHRNDFNLNLFHNSYVVLWLKLLVGFIMLVVQIDLSGKSNLAQSTTIDQMQNYVLGGIIGGMIYNSAITILQFTIILLLWSIIIFGGKILAKNTNLFKNILIGKPRTVIKNGHVNIDDILKMGMSADDLMFNLRLNGINDYRKVKNASIERNGSLTIDNENQSDAYIVIADGAVNHDALVKLNMTEQDLKQRLVVKGKSFTFKQVFLAQIIDGELSFILYPQIKNKTIVSRIRKYLWNSNSNVN